MKQITEPIAVSSYVQSEYAAVLNRLQSMGFTHSSGYSIKNMMSNWADYPIFDISEIRPRTFNRNASSDYFTSIIPAAQFLAEYGPAEVGVPKAPLNPPNFIIKTHDNPTLFRITQELAFEHGMEWVYTGKGLIEDSVYREFLVVRQDHIGPSGWRFRAGKLYGGNGGLENIPVYSAATQMGEIILLLSTPVVPPAPPPPTPPEIHGYKAVYKAGSAMVRFGCAGISKALLSDAAKLMGCVIQSDGSVMKNAGSVRADGSNRGVDSITLSSGKILNRAQITEILGYVAAVEEYAVKHPSTLSPAK